MGLCNDQWDFNFRKLMQKWDDILSIKRKLKEKFKIGNTWNVETVYVLLEKLENDLSQALFDIQPIYLK